MQTTDYSVKEQTAIVTGASRGIGKAIANRFVNDGANVVICSRTKSEIEAVAETLSVDAPGTILPIECDISDQASVEALTAAAVEEYGGLDILVNNAGGGFPTSFTELSENAWKTIVDINLHGVFRCSREAASVMERGGSIINIASQAGVLGAPNLSHYGAAKAGVINLTRTLGVELADENVRVNAVAPGLIATQGIEDQFGITAAEIDTASVNRQTGTGDEIAKAVQFLASPAASFIQGETINVRGVPPVEGIAME
jgi:NAD(P)-dependent dehydrogenase (short-subunit alcohol dehydrogenase family)